MLECRVYLLRRTLNMVPRGRRTITAAPGLYAEGGDQALDWGPALFSARRPRPKEVGGGEREGKRARAVVDAASTELHPEPSCAWPVRLRGTVAPHDEEPLPPWAPCCFGACGCSRHEGRPSPIGWAAGLVIAPGCGPMTAPAYLGTRWLPPPRSRFCCVAIGLLPASVWFRFVLHGSKAATIQASSLALHMQLLEERLVLVWHEGGEALDAGCDMSLLHCELSWHGRQRQRAAVKYNVAHSRT